MPDSYDVVTADKLSQAEQLIGEFFEDYDPNLYLVDAAAVRMRQMTKMKRLLEAGLLNTARRLEKAHVHTHEGFKTAGGWLSTITGEPVGQAAASLEAARTIEEHPLVQEAFSSGRLSEAQAKEIASASDASPEEARNLLDQAVSGLGLGELKRRCREIRSAAGSEAEEIARHEKIRKTRFCRTWVDSEGAGHLEARMTTDALGILRSVLGGYEKQVFEDARKSGLRETRQAYMADALVAMAQGSVPSDSFDEAGTADACATDPADPGAAGRRTFRPPRALVRVVVSGEALLRGHVLAGETCEIPGLGPVPVARARELLDDAILELVVTRGVDVTTVVSDSRYVRKALRIALEQRDQVCVVPNCNISDPLERDHWQVDYSKDGPTELDNLARLCPWHHDQKTHKGWRLLGPPGQWQFIPPDKAPAANFGTDREPRSEPPTGESRAGPGDTGPPSRGTGDRAKSSGPRQKARAKDPPIQPPLL